MKKLKNIRYLPLLITMAWGVAALPSVSLAGVDGGVRGRHHDGYLFDVVDERNTRIVEMMIQAKPSSNEKSLEEVIFEPKLKREFVLRYESQFGRTDTDRNVDAPNRFDQLEYSPGVRVTVQEDVDRKQQFGEFMVRRLGEHHVDAYFKSSPTVRPIYEVKQRISNVSLTVKKGYKFKVNYSYAANTLHFGMENPYEVKNRLTLEMDPTSIGPSNVQETVVDLGYDVSKKVSVTSHYRMNKGEVQLVTSRRLSRTMAASVSGSSISGSGSVPQSRILFGLSWND